MLDSKSEYKNLTCIYKIVCEENGYVYIGQTTNMGRRLREHRIDLKKNKHRNHQLQDDYNKYGVEKFHLEIISSCIDDDLDEIEKNEISHARENCKCYNVFGGGKTGYTVTEEFREKISRANKGRIVSDETKKKMSENAKKQWKNDKYKTLMIESAKNQWKDENYRNKMIEVVKNIDVDNRPTSILTKEKAENARREYKEGASVSELAKKYGTHYSTMRNMLAGLTWK